MGRVRRALNRSRGVLIGATLLNATAHAATLSGSVTLKGKAAADTVVYLEGPAAPAAAPASNLSMDQKNLRFLPHVLPVVRGTSVEFTNSDKVQHNVFSPSAIAGKFNLGTYAPGSVRTVKFDTPGDVRVLCNIHMEMEAHILVLEQPYYAVVDENGAYRIGHLPPGHYSLKVWRDRWLPLTRSVDVAGDQAVTVDLELAQ